MSPCIGGDEADGGKTRHLCKPRRPLGGDTSSCETCVRVWCMVVSMGWGVSDGRMVDGEAIFNMMIYDMETSRRSDIRDGRMTYGVVVFSAITFDIVVSRR